MTFEEFFEWCDEDTRAEWVNGRVELLAPVNVEHQRIVTFLAKVLGTYVDARQLGTLIAGPAGFRSMVIPSFREPDLFFVSRAHEARVQVKYVDGAPDLAIEIVSPSDPGKDKKIKFEEYARSGVREYWVIDPTKQDVGFYTLGLNHRFVPRPVSQDGVYQSDVVTGFFLRLPWLWEQPPVLPLFRELGLI